MLTFKNIYFNILSVLVLVLVPIPGLLWTSLYFTLQNHQIWQWVVTDGTPPWSLRWDPCVVSKFTPEDDAHQVYAVHMYVHHSHTDRTYSHHWKQQSDSILQSTLSWHQSSHAWRWHGVSGSLAKGTYDLSPAAADCSQRPLVTQQVKHVPGFLSWMQLPLLVKCVNLDVHLFYVAVQNLFYGCGNVPYTTAESSDMPPLHCAQHVQQSIDMSIQLPEGLLCDPIQMAELQKQVQDAWHSLLQDDIWHVYECLHVRIHACVATRATLWIDVTVWAPLTVTCVLFGLNLSSYTLTKINYLSQQFGIQCTCPWGCCIIIIIIIIFFSQQCIS